MTVIRTPDERFAALPDFPFAPHYVQVGDTRMHYVDEGEGRRDISCPSGDASRKISQFYAHI